MLAWAYNDSDKVLKAFEEFRSSVIYKNEKESNLVISNLLTLLKEMANIRVIMGTGIVVLLLGMWLNYCHCGLI